MIPVDFDYVRPANVAEAAAMLTDAAAGSVAILAGGQSLVTELKRRTRRPKLVLDLGGIGHLKTIGIDGHTVSIGAMVSQGDLVRNPFIRDRLGILVETGAVAADPMVRGKGTLVGALCQADPNGDWVAACLVLDAVVELRRGSTTREMAIRDFVIGPGRNALQSGEFVTALRVVAPSGRSGAYRKVRHTAIGWSIAGLAAAIEVAPDGRCTDCRLAASGALAWPQRLIALEEQLVGLRLRDAPRLGELIEHTISDLDFQSDRHASGAYRATRLSVLLRRVLSDPSTASEGAIGHA